MYGSGPEIPKQAHVKYLDGSTANYPWTLDVGLYEEWLPKYVEFGRDMGWGDGAFKLVEITETHYVFQEVPRNV